MDPALVYSFKYSVLRIVPFIDKVETFINSVIYTLKCNLLISSITYLQQISKVLHTATQNYSNKKLI